MSYAYKPGAKPDNADALLPSSSVHIEGQEYNLETTPSADGWTFTGWLDSSDKEVTGKQTMGTTDVTYYGKWEQKKPDVEVVKTATYTRGDADPVALPYDPNNPDVMETVQVDDVINYTVTIKNTGNVTFGKRNEGYTGSDCFNYATGKLDILDENGIKTGTIESGKCGNINIEGMNPGDIRTFKYKYTVLPSDAGITINNNANVLINAEGVSKQLSSKVNVKVEKPKPTTATLSFEFKSGTEDKDLPAGMPTEPKDVTEEVGKEVQLTNYTATVDDNNGKWSFNGWYTDDNLSADSKITGDTYPMPNGGGTLYGKWTFTKNTPETATLRFEFKSGTDGKDLPASGMPPVPNDVTEEVGTAVQLAHYIETVDDGENNGKWTFVGWYTDADCTKAVAEPYVMPNTDTKLYGKWTFTENTPEPQPGLSVEKKAYLVGEGDETTEITATTKVRPGDTIQYVITIRNTGNTVLNNLTVSDAFTAAAANDLVIEGGVLPENATLAKGGKIEIKATYVVRDNDVTVKNKVTVTTDDVTGEDEVITDIDRGDVDGYEVSGWIKKIVESKKGSFKKDASFTFDIWADEACTDRLKTIAISKEWAVTKDDYDVKAETFSFGISENKFNKLNEENGRKVIYVTERKGDIKGMTYDSDVVTMYLRKSPVVVNSLNIVDSYEATTNLMLDEAAPAEFTNVYKKPADKGETIKSGPQLNRDDHVAYIMGYPDGTVQPEGEITRAEACTIFFRLLTDSSRDYYFARTNDYSDVNRGDWFNNAISTLSNAGIVTGYNDGTFRPNQPITRGEMAKIIANFANLKYGGKTFTDLAGHWSKSYVELAAGNGWIAGYPDGSFRPDQKITRAETVTMINRVLDRVPAKESRLLSRSIMLTFPDNKPGDWYYIAIQEASNSHEYQRSVYETTGDEMWTKLIDNVDWTKLEK